MDFEELRGVPTEAGRNLALYEGIFTDEKGRLSGQAMSVEKLTTLRVLAETLQPGATVLDLGCGAGVYALPLARAGHEVTAIDPVPHHIRQLKEAMEPGMMLEARVGDALSALAAVADKSLDAVLCLGPLYHLHSREDRLAVLRHIRRVLVPGGHALLAFINSDFVIATETLRFAPYEYLLEGDYDKDSFEVDDFPFQFHTLGEARAEVQQAGLTTLRMMSSDGLAELHQQQIDAMHPAQFAQWLRYHDYLCEQPHFVGMGNHFLFVCGKGDSHAV